MVENEWIEKIVSSAPDSYQNRIELSVFRRLTLSGVLEDVSDRGYPGVTPSRSRIFISAR